MSSGDVREEREEHTEERDLLVKEEEGKQKQKMQRKSQISEVRLKISILEIRFVLMSCSHIPW